VYAYTQALCVCVSSGLQLEPHFLVTVQSLGLRGGDRGSEHWDVGGWGGGGQMLKLSPQPHVLLMLGLLKTNSLDSMDSTKSISVPSRVSWAFFSMNTLTPARKSRSGHVTTLPLHGSFFTAREKRKKITRLTVLQHLLVRVPLLLCVV